MTIPFALGHRYPSVAALNAVLLVDALRWPDKPYDLLAELRAALLQARFTLHRLGFHNPSQYPQQDANLRVTP